VAYVPVFPKLLHFVIQAPALVSLQSFSSSIHQLLIELTPTYIIISLRSPLIQDLFPFLVALEQLDLE